MLKLKNKHIQKAILIFLLLSNIFAFNYSSGINLNSADKNLIVESLSTQDVIISVIKTTKINSQKIDGGTSVIISNNASGLVKFKNFVKTPPTDFQLLSFQFFLSSQFSTST